MLTKDINEDFLVSRGEYITSKMMAEYLGYHFVDASDVIKFNYEGSVNIETSYTLIEEAIKKYSEDKPKGEFVVIVEGKKKEAYEITLEEAAQMAQKLVENGMSVNAAAKEISSQTPFKKSDIYKELV